MAWSLLNNLVAEDVKALLDKVDAGSAEPMMERQKAESIIHAVLWAYSCRSDSIAAYCAMEALRKAITEQTARWMLARFEADRMVESARIAREQGRPYVPEAPEVRLANKAGEVFAGSRTEHVLAAIAMLMAQLHKDSEIEAIDAATRIVGDVACIYHKQCGWGPEGPTHG